MAPSPHHSVLQQALPGLLVAVATTALTIGATLVGFTWRQTITLAEMAKTLTVVCQQLEQKTAKDQQQDEAIQGLRVDVEGLRHR
jgi:hypothetical protein